MICAGCQASMVPLRMRLPGRCMCEQLCSWHVSRSEVARECSRLFSLNGRQTALKPLWKLAHLAAACDLALTNLRSPHYAYSIKTSQGIGRRGCTDSQQLVLCRPAE